MRPTEYDFSGWATKYNVPCADGRTICRGAFKDCDGTTIPLVYAHQHDTIDNVLGHVYLEERDEGVYAYGTFNKTNSGLAAKEAVSNKDLTGLSIYANRLKQQGRDVNHGVLREVSLVLAGANPQALIDSIVCHDGVDLTEEGYITFPEEITLSHSEDETIGDVLSTLTDKQMSAVAALLAEYEPSDDVEHSDELTDEDIFMTEENELEHSDMESTPSGIFDTNDFSEEEFNVKHNIFEQDEIPGDTLTHDEMTAVIEDAKRYGSMKESVLQHGIENIDYLFPDHKTLNTTPEFISRKMGWVTKVIAGVHHTPFSRIRSTFADITADEARAKGYIKGKLKKEEVFSLLKRTTDPTTIYKKQALHRDDIVDITDFNVVSWLKAEMRTMLDEEIARAILIGDGRLSSDEDHIDETKVRPVSLDSELYTIQSVLNVASEATEADKAKAFISTAIRSRKDYKGSGSPTLFTTEDVLTELLLLEDGIGHLLYDDEAKLAKTLRVSEIVTVPVMEGVKGKNGGDLLGIIVNLKDYNVGADKGGAINMFDDFDIDYNKEKYLIETRCSGALTKPYSAIAITTKAPTVTPNP